MVRVRVRARVREWDFPFFFLFSVLKVTNTFVLHGNVSWGVHGPRTTKVCDVTMMYCKEQYMENVSYLSLKHSQTSLRDT